MEAFLGLLIIAAIIGGAIYMSKQEKEKKSKQVKRARASGDSPVTCPVCGSAQLSAGKKGYDAGAGCCGAILVGPLGLLCGAAESSDVMITCLKCGHQWKAGRD